MGFLNDANALKTIFYPPQYFNEKGNQFGCLFR
jgi:hypothetical protein